MLGKLLLLFIIVPMTELVLLVWIADRTSIWATLALVITTGVIGSMLARQQGVRAWRRCREAMAKGEMPAVEIQNGLMIAFAAALLLTPGIITDAVGLLILIPYTREWIRSYLARRIAANFKVTVINAHASRTVDIDASSWSDESDYPRQPETPRARTITGTIDAVNIKHLSE